MTRASESHRLMRALVLASAVLGGCFGAPSEVPRESTAGERTAATSTATDLVYSAVLSQRQHYPPPPPVVEDGFRRVALVDEMSLSLNDRTLRFESRGRPLAERGANLAEFVAKKGVPRALADALAEVLAAPSQPLQIDGIDELGVEFVDRQTWNESVTTRGWFEAYEDVTGVKGPPLALWSFSEVAFSSDMKQAAVVADFRFICLVMVLGPRGEGWEVTHEVMLSME